MGPPADMPCTANVWMPKSSRRPRSAGQSSDRSSRCAGQTADARPVERDDAQPSASACSSASALRDAINHVRGNEAQPDRAAGRLQIAQRAAVRRTRAWRQALCPSRTGRRSYQACWNEPVGPGNTRFNRRRATLSKDRDRPWRRVIGGISYPLVMARRKADPSRRHCNRLRECPRFHILQGCRLRSEYSQVRPRCEITSTGA